MQIKAGISPLNTKIIAPVGICQTTNTVLFKTTIAAVFQWQLETHFLTIACHIYIIGCISMHSNDSCNMLQYTNFIIVIRVSNPYNSYYVTIDVQL